MSKKEKQGKIPKYTAQASAPTHWFLWIKQMTLHCSYCVYYFLGNFYFLALMTTYSWIVWRDTKITNKDRTKLTKQVCLFSDSHKAPQLSLHSKCSTSAVLFISWYVSFALSALWVLIFYGKAQYEFNKSIIAIMGQPPHMWGTYPPKRRCIIN